MDQHKYLTLRLANNVKRGRNSVIVMNNTRATVTPNGDIVVRHFNTDILRVTPTLTHVLSSWNSHTTRKRFNEYLPSGWYVRADDGGQVLVGPNGFIIPLAPGCAAGFDTAPIADLMMPFMAGNVDAAHDVAWYLDSIGLPDMAYIARDQAGARFAYKGRVRELKAASAEYPQPSDTGLWIVDSNGVLVRPITAFEATYHLPDLTPDRDVQLRGATVRLVDGFNYSATRIAA